MEADLRRLDDKWQKSVDDIKATIRAEISDLKTEQIADLKSRLKDGYDTLNAFDKRLDAIEHTQAQWKTSAGVANWLIRFVIFVIGTLGGIFGWEVIRHP